jgi:ubiquinone/menaquinone biosynthesis C-methylase UbiE/uncharacterized protein YbaR (Trm112 family)
VDTEHLVDVLRCNSCGAPYRISAAECVCTGCGRRFPVVDDMPVLLDGTTTPTALDDIDYDAVMGIDEGVISEIAENWSEVIGGLGPRPRRALEIGAGSGALTLGLLRGHVVEHLTATDVSPKFLRSIAPRAAGSPTPVSFVVCDANVAQFRPEAFDLIVGRSALHHVLDYDETLRQCRAMLRDGGSAVFYEPVLEGKTITTLLMALMVRCDEMMNLRILTDHERTSIRRQIRHQMKSTFLPQDRETLAGLEDKYIFDVAEMTKVGLAVGFREVQFVNDTRDLPYWAYVSHTCQIVGVAPERIRAYEWIEEEFAETLGRVYPERLVSPVGYFIFRR